MSVCAVPRGVGTMLKEIAAIFRRVRFRKYFK